MSNASDSGSSIRELPDRERNSRDGAKTVICEFYWADFISMQRIQVDGFVATVEGEDEKLGLDWLPVEHHQPSDW